MTTREMVERMLIDIDEGVGDPSDLEFDDAMSEAELMVLLSQMPEVEARIDAIQ